MKIASFVLLIISFAIITHAQTKSDAAKQRIKGPVQTLTEASYRPVVKDSTTQEELYTLTLKKYSELGYQVENAILNTKGVVLAKNVCEYDNNGLQTNNKTYKGDSLQEYTLAKYGKNKTMMESAVYKSGKLQRYATFHCDKHGNPTVTNNYRADSTLESKQLITFDKQGKITKIESYKPGDTLVYKVTYQYDDAGNEVTTERYGSNGQLKSTTTYLYDDFDKNGNWLKRNSVQDNKTFLITRRKIEYY